jgi:HNH endonuclease
MNRTAIPAHVKQLVLLEAGYKCANPVCRHILTLELHHIVWVKDGGSNDPDNLLALCPNCHSLHTQGHIPEKAIRTWKSLLLALNSTNHATADLLLLLAADEERIASPANVTESTDPNKIGLPFRFTGDGLPALSGLLASGLIRISKYYSGLNQWGGSMPSFEVRLTEKGKALVAAWRSGTGSVEDALAISSETSQATGSDV